MRAHTRPATTTPHTAAPSSHALRLSRILAIRRRPFAIRHYAFTLVEIVVVVAVIMILVGLVVPSVSTIWDERKAAEAETFVKGNLLTTRAAAIHTGKRRGLFFMVDPDDNTQKMFPIEEEPFDPTNPDDASVTEAAAVHRFRIADENEVPLASPHRVGPRAVIDNSSDADFYWSEIEIARTPLEYDDAGHTQFERQRNFFTIVFSNTGQLLVRENVLIHDADVDGDGDGDRTGLSVATVANWLDPAVRPFPAGGPLTDMICDDSSSAAINFPSVDGLLAYDDAALVEQPTDSLKRQYLLDYGQPLYVVRLTGQVIRGPKAENE